MSNVSMFTFSNAVEAGGIRALRLPPQGSALHAPATLGGYDVVWALAPETLRAQFGALQQAGRLPVEVQAGNLDEAGLLIGGEGADRVLLAPPQLLLGAAAPRSASLKLTFTSGNISFYNGNRSGVLKQSVAGWKLAFAVTLQLEPVALAEALAGASPECAEALSRFDESRYCLHKLVPDFAQCDPMQADWSHSALVTDNDFLKDNFTKLIGAWLKDLGGAGNPFVLGYASVRLAPGDEVLARLQAGCVNLSSGGTVNLLQMLGRKPSTDGRNMTSVAGLADLRPGYAPGCAGRLVVARDVFFKRFLKPMLIDPIQERLSLLPDYRNLRVAPDVGLNRDESFNEKSGVSATLDNAMRAVFVANAGGWGYRDHVLLHWREGNRLSHVRESEQDLQFSVTVSTQPDGAGVPRLTVDLYSSLMRYEWDRASQKMALFNRKVNLGKGWARSTMHWSMRLQFVPDDSGVVRLAVNGKRAPAATDSGVVGMYVVSDALAHLLNMNKLTNDWEGNPASLASLQQTVVAEFGETSAELFSQLAGQLVLPTGPQPGCRSIQLNEEGNIELDLGW
ncbi:hypothetical protein LJR289_001403 [Pseudoduganella sp. LjRoot289]|uniref:hypothetical protein n=1 Tax=Pseudoduganella sp. LjRoot289 TaxID=3342314 RepID=UPI003ED11CA9